MTDQNDEIARRSKIALDAIEQAASSGGEDSAVHLFVSHHLGEIDAPYWQKHTGSPNPTLNHVIGTLQLQSHWSDDDEFGVDIVDFTLPEDVTQYVISVKFGMGGQVEEIEMES